MRAFYRLASVAMLTALAACTQTDGGGLCSLMGPCATVSNTPFTTVVGFPADRISTGGDARLSAGQTFTLYAVRVTRPETPCAAHDTIRTAVQWATSDTLIADVTVGPNGEGRFRAKKSGSFGIMMYTPYTGHIPAGAIVTPVWVCPERQLTISNISVE